MHFFKKILLPGILLLSFSGSFLCFFIFYREYWVYRNLFENGRYFDPVRMVVHADEAVFYIVPAVVLLGMGVALSLLLLRSVRHACKQEQ